MFIPDPGSWFFYPSRIPDPKILTKKRAEKHFYGYKFHKIENYFIFEMLKKTKWPSFQRIVEFFTQKFVTKLYKIWVWDPGSGIRDPGSGTNLFQIRDPVPGVKKAPDPRSWSGSATLGDPWHFGADPDPRIRISDWWIRIRILLFSSVTFKMATKTKFIFKALWLLLYEGTFTSFFKDKKSKRSQKTVGIRFYILGH
jgi:hypothetical protein